MGVDFLDDQRANRVSCVALSVALFFPFLYYPVVTLFWLGDSPLGGVYKDAIAALAALSTFAALGLSLWQRRSKWGRQLEPNRLLQAPETWFVMFLGWLVAISLLQREPSTVQNLIVYTVFIGVALVAGTVSIRFTRVLRVFVWVFAGILIVVGLWETIGDPLGSEVGWQLGGPRLYASYGIVATAGLFAVSIPTWIRVLLGLGLLAGAVASDSRAAMTVLLLTLIAGFAVSSRRPWRTLLMSGSGGLVLFLAALQTPGIASRMAPVYSTTTPGMPIHDSGRGFAWIETAESWLGEPFSGNGAGSSQSLARTLKIPLDHPHSEYLRILHDAGLIGFAFFAAFVVLALVWLWPRAAGKPRGELVVGGFLIVVAGLVLGTIENFLVFPSLMWPAAVFLGLGLGGARRDGQSWFDARRRVRAASSEKTELPQT